MQSLLTDGDLMMSMLFKLWQVIFKKCCLLSANWVKDIFGSSVTLK